MVTANHTTVRVRVLLFASYAELVGHDTIEVIIPEPATASGVVAKMRQSVPGAERLPQRPLVALNQTHVKLDVAVRDGDELAILPPMAGG